LLQKSVNYDRKKFYGIDPWPENHTRHKHSTLFYPFIGAKVEKFQKADTWKKQTHRRDIPEAE